MAVTLVTTIGSASANSFVTLAEANAYFEDRSYADQWAGDDSEKNIWLAEAAILMQEFGWLGCRVDETQSLAYPRYGVRKPDAWCDYLSTEIPQRVKDAQCEIALAIKQGGSNGPLLSGVAATGNVKSFHLGKLSVVKDASTTPTSALQIPRVWRLLRDLVSVGQRRRG